MSFIKDVDDELRQNRRVWACFTCQRSAILILLIWYCGSTLCYVIGVLQQMCVVGV